MTRVRAGEGQATEARVVVGYDGSDSARRAVARGVRAAGPRGQVILVAVEPKMHDDGIVAEQLVERGDKPSQLLAEAQAIAAADVRHRRHRRSHGRGRQARQPSGRNPGGRASGRRRSHRRRTHRQELSRSRDPRFSGRPRRPARALRRPRRRLNERAPRTNPTSPLLLGQRSRLGPSRSSPLGGLRAAQPLSPGG